MALETVPILAYPTQRLSNPRLDSITSLGNAEEFHLGMAR